MFNYRTKEQIEVRFRIGFVAKVKLFFYVLTNPWDVTDMIIELANDVSRQDIEVQKGYEKIAELERELKEKPLTKE